MQNPSIFTFSADRLAWALESQAPKTLEQQLREAQVAHPPHQKKVEDPIARIINAAIAASCTIYVKSPDGQWSGSGFHIGHGVIVTAAHVVPAEISHSSAEIAITFDGQHLYPAQIVVSEKKFDSALLMCQPIAKTISTVLLGDSNKVQVGDIIAVIGSPEGWHDTATVGRITNLHQELGPNAPTPAWNDIIFIDADILEGASGGMVIGTDGLVVGSVMGVTGQHADLGLGERAACPSNKIRTLVSKFFG